MTNAGASATHDDGGARPARAPAGGLGRPRPPLGRLLLRRTGPAGHEGLRLDHRHVRRGTAGGLPVRDGRRPGHAGRGQRRRRLRRGQLPDLHRARPADLRRGHDGRQRVHLPGDGRLQMAARLLRPARLAADPGTDRRRPGHRRHRPLPAAVGHLLCRRRAVRGRPRRLGLGLDPHRHPRRAVLRPAAHGLRGHHQGGQGPVRHGHAVHRHAAVPVLRHVLPAGHASARRPLDRLDLPDLARHGTRPRGQLRVRGRAVAHRSSTSSSCWAWQLPAGS